MRRYTRQELEKLDITTLKAICRELRIKSETISLFDDKGALVQLIYKYRGTVAERYINEWRDESVARLQRAIAEKGEEFQKNVRVEIPAYFSIYKGIDSLNERGFEHKVHTDADLDMTSAALVDHSGAIKALINVAKGSAGAAKNTYFLHLRDHMLCKDIRPGIYKSFRILFFPGDYERIQRIYNMAPAADGLTRFTYISKSIQEVVVHEVKQTDDALVIDYGTSYTTAGTYIDGKIKHVMFYSDSMCERSPVPARIAECQGCGRCALCPSVIAVKDCGDADAGGAGGGGGSGAGGSGRNAGYGVPSPGVPSPGGAGAYDGFVGDAHLGVPQPGFPSPHGVTPPRGVPSPRGANAGGVELLFGHDATDRMPMARNSIFFDTKRWVNDYNEIIEVKDLAGNTASIRRGEIIERFMQYIIHTAVQQNKVIYKNICFTSPVKQKAMSNRMYKDILPGYNVEEKDSIDEAVAVLYDSLTEQVENLGYADGYVQSALLIDCGGSTSDMVKCDYAITHMKKHSNIGINIRYANGDTNFGGNNLTFRVMQYLKIKLAHHYRRKASPSVDSLLDILYCDVYDFIDRSGIKAAYESFEEAYRDAGSSIPTNYSDYVNDTETAYLNVRGNFYFLWDLAERIKVDLYSSSSAYEFSFADLRDSRGIYLVSVKNEKGSFVAHTEWPQIRILRDEINMLLKPEIYNLLKKFIEPYYNDDETMSEIAYIMLSGQTTKIDLFRDVLKEYIAGRKARSPYEQSYVKKLKCIRGAVAYRGAKDIGRILPSIAYESAIVPYNLTVETFSEDKEKVLISQGQQLSKVYSFIDRTYETKLIIFHLRDHDREILQNLKFNLDLDSYVEVGYSGLMENNAWLSQGDVDRIEDGEVRLFVYSDDESWGFKWLGVANKGGSLLCGRERFVPFESTVWEMNFFNGKR